MEIAAGSLIGARYRLERRIGQGGMGVVWAAEDVATRQRIALKLLKDGISDPDAPKRFLREARAASAVRNVTHVARATRGTGVEAAASSDAGERDPEKAAERQRIVAALEQCAGNQTRAAKLLGISLRTLVNRLAEHKLVRPRKHS